MTLSTPDASSRSATSLAVIGARRGLAVLARVAVMRDDGRHVVGAGPLGGVGHDQQLHQGIVDVHARTAAHGLDEEDLLAAHAFLIARVDLAVGELLKLDVAQRHGQLLGDVVCQPGIDRTREQGDGPLFRHDVRSFASLVNRWFHGFAAPRIVTAAPHFKHILAALTPKKRRFAQGVLRHTPAGTQQVAKGRRITRQNPRSQKKESAGGILECRRRCAKRRFFGLNPTSSY